MLAQGKPSGFRLSRYSLQFGDRGVEMAFMKSRAEKLIRHMRYCALIMAVFDAAGVTGICIVDGKWVDNGSVLTGLALFIFLLAVATGSNLDFWMRRGNVFRECAAATVVLLGMLSMLPMQPWYLAKLIGKEALDPGHNLLLSLDMIVTASHMFLPIRWCILVQLEIVSFLVFLIPSILFGHPTGDTAALLADASVFSILIVSASFGKRAMEHEERYSFSRVIAEKTLRVQTEFKLVKFEGQAQSEVPRSVATSPGSEGPRSAATSERAFAQLGMSSDLLKELDAVIALGRRERWILRSDELNMQNSALLGQGGFGKVLTARLFGTPIVVKTPLQPIHTWGSNKADQLKSIGNEIRLLRRLRHPSIVLFHGAIVFEECELGHPGKCQLGLVLEHVQGDNLDKSLIHLQICDLVSVSIGLCRAMRYMHSMEPPIIHGDLKPSNILVSNQRPMAHAKIIDFGLSCILARGSKAKGGTEGWTAPEQVSQPEMSPTKGLDIFALGSILYYMEASVPPMTRSLSDEHGHICTDSQGRLPWPTEGMRNVFQGAAREAAHAFLTLQPESRPDDPSSLQEHLEAMQGNPESTGGTRTQQLDTQDTMSLSAQAPSSNCEPRFLLQDSCNHPSTQIIRL